MQNKQKHTHNKSMADLGRWRGCEDCLGWLLSKTTEVKKKEKKQYSFFTARAENNLKICFIKSIFISTNE